MNTEYEFENALQRETLFDHAILIVQIDLQLFGSFIALQILQNEQFRSNFWTQNGHVFGAQQGPSDQVQLIILQYILVPH